MSKKAPPRVETELPYHAFATEADKDYLLARWVNFSGPTFHARAAYFAQQACEKYMKAEIVKSTKGFLKTHRLHDLADDCATRDGMFNHPKLREALAAFDDFAELGRYGGFANKNHANFEKSFKKDPGIEIIGAYVWSPQYIQLLDQFAFNIRRLFEYGVDRWPDQLAAIAEDRKCMFSDDWKGQPSLKAILTTGNPVYSGRPLSTDTPG